MAEVRNNPKIINTPARLQFVINRLIGWGDGYIDSHLPEEVKSQGLFDGKIIRDMTKLNTGYDDDGFYLELKPVREIATDVDVTRRAYCPEIIPNGEVIRYRWDEIPEELFDKIAGYAEYGSHDSVLTMADKVNTIKDRINDGSIPNGDSRKSTLSPYMEYDDEEDSILSTTGEVPYFNYTRKAFNNTYDEGYTIECHIHSFDGISILKNGRFVICDVRLDEILEWEDKAEKYDKIVSQIKSFTDEV